MAAEPWVERPSETSPPGAPSVPSLTLWLDNSLFPVILSIGVVFGSKTYLEND
jgi:hypothetical protein